MTKRILRQAMADRLPIEIIRDTRKIRFSGPAEYWLRNGLRGTLASLFLGSSCPRLGELADSTALVETVQQFLADGRPPQVPLVWRLFSAEMWLQRFFS